MKKIKKLLVMLISYTLIFMPLHASTLQTDGTTNTTLDTARNGVPVVNIANPNSTGLSHNKFTNYNVQKQGLILNNSLDTTVNTQLGGYIFGNRNLNSNAKVILNEVTSTSRTQLNGYTEVAGKRADLIIANPNGLSINGAGFINTSSVTLTTGTPVINGVNLESFNVMGGDITIQGDGLDTTTQDSTKIYTHYLKINAAIHANNLDIKLGQLDSSALGGMYANRISLVGTDKGLGVNLPPEVLASAGEITITNDGIIHLQNIKAKSSINITSTSSNIDIEDKLTSANNINLEAKDITNNSLVNASNDLTITSDNLTNNKTLFSGNDMYLYTNETLLNNEDANIFAVNNLTMARDNFNAKTQTIENRSASIETYSGDIGTYADSFKNIAINLPIKSSYVESSIRYDKRLSSKWRTRGYITTTIESLDKTGYIPATLLSGGDLLIDANSDNKYSLISAVNDITFLGSLNNEANLEANKIVRTTGYVQHCDKKSWPKSGCSWKHKYNTDTSVFTLLDNADSTIQAGGSITGVVTNLTNGSVKDYDSITSSTTLDTSTKTLTYLNSDGIATSIIIPTDNDGLFVKTTDLTAKFLIETNPELTIYKNFISSDYMMSHIEYDSQVTAKRLGDAFYENTRVRDSIFKQSGRRFLNSNIKNDNEQYKYLMDNAISASKALELSPGISLSKAQIDALTNDIVWMEEKIVAGEKVLVPVVYIANIDNFKLEGARIVAGKNINIEATDTITNLGGEIIADKDIKLQATNNIINESGTIKADNIELTSTDGNIINRRYTKTITTSARKSKATTTLIGKEGQIIAANNLNVNADKNIEIVGSKLNAKEINLNAKNVDITTTLDKKDFFGGSSDTYIKEQSTSNIASNIQADNINIDATSINIQASTLQAKENLNLTAQKTITIASAEDIYSYKSKSKSDGGLLGGNEKTQDIKNTTTQIKSLLQAKNITLHAKQIDQIASDIKAVEIEITTEVLNLISKKDSKYESHFSDSSGLFLRNIKSKGEIKEIAKESTIQTQKLIFNNEDITDKLSSEYNLNINQINQVKAILQDEDWNESHTSLTTVGAIIVAIVVTVITAGIGTGEAVAGLTAAQAAATTTAATAAATGTAVATAAAATAASALTTATVTAAVTNAVIAGATTQLATATITGEEFKLDVESLAKGAVTAGVLSYAGTLIDSTLGIQNVKYKTLTLSQKLSKGIANTTVKSGVNSALYGVDFEDSFVSALGSEAQIGLSNYIGSSYYDGELNYFEHKLSHALAGATGSAIAGKDIASGAIGAVSGEIIGEAVGKNLIQDRDFSKIDKAIVQLTSQLGTLAIAGATNADMQIAVDSSKVAVDNNLLLHIPGTFASKKDVDTEYQKEVEKIEGENMIIIGNGEDNEIPLGNNDKDRKLLAQKIVNKIKNHNFKENESLKIYGHSHGGNVAKLVTHMMVEQGINRKLDKIVFLATPVRDDYTINNLSLNKNAKVYNVYDSSDLVQNPSGGIDSNSIVSFPSKQLINSPIVQNIEVESPDNINIYNFIFPIPSLLKDNFLNDHSNIDSKQVIKQITKDLKNE